MIESPRLVLAHLLTLIALIGAAIEYAELLRRRAARRRDLAAAQDAGFRGLVRVLLGDGS